MWRGKRAMSGLEQDIRDHIERETENNIALGMPPEEARRQACVKFGSVALAVDDTRAVWAWVWLEQLWQDVRYAVRTLSRSPGFAAAVVITLGLGIGVNTAMFSMLDAVVLQKLPVPDAHELIALYETAPKAVPDTVGGRGRYMRFSYPRFVRLQQVLGTHGSLAAMTRTTLFAGRLHNGQRMSVGVQLVSGDYFETLRVRPTRGRLLTAADADTASAPVAVISNHFWKAQMGAVDDAIGQQLEINGVAATVVGVAPLGFTGAWLDDNPDVWLPLTLESAVQYRTNTSSYGPVDPNQSFLGQDRIAWLHLVGRVRGPDRQLAETLLQNANRLGLREFAIAATTNARGRAEFLAQKLAIEPLAHGFSRLRAEHSGMLLALMGLVAMVLILTAANVANLLLVRAGLRGREVAVRLALGATTNRIVRHVLTEALLLAGLGGVAGVLAAGWSRHVLAREIVGRSSLLPAGFSLDMRTLSFAVGVSLVTAMVFGLAPALRAARAGGLPSTGLNERHTVGLGTMKGMRPLVVLQLALSVVVVFGATLLSRSLMNLVRVDPGFAVEHLVSASFDARRLASSANALTALADRLVSATNAVPGARSAAVSVCGLLAGCSYNTDVRIEGVEGTVDVQQNWVGPKYFATVGLPLLRGRAFDERDTEHGLPVAIITDSVARRYFAGRDPIGRRLSGLAALGQRYDAEIVGVVGDLRPVSLREEPVSMVFYPLSRRRADAVPTALDIRVSGDPDQAVRTVREALKRAVPGFTFNVTSMPMRLSEQMERDRTVAYLTSAFGGLALLLASVGLYGVLSYIVAQRNREIGLRMALGAQRSEVLALVFKQGAVLALIGLTLGLAAAPLATRSLQGMFFEVTPLDPPTFIAVASIMLIVAALAAIIPARRATKVDPMVALRCD
jgi:predicted permease